MMCSLCGARPPFARGLCNPCYQRLYKAGGFPYYTGTIRCGDKFGGFGFVWDSDPADESQIVMAQFAREPGRPLVGRLVPIETLRSQFMGIDPNEDGRLLVSETSAPAGRMATARPSRGVLA